MSARSADEKKFDRLFFSLSLPFRWISALADVVPGRWYDDLCPYSAKVEFKIGGETGSDCLIRYSIPEDAVLKGTYLRPLITVSCSSCPTIEFSENTESFDHCYRSHAKNAVSLIFIAVCLFGALLYAAIKHSNVQASLICGALLTVLPLYALLALLFQKRQMLRMRTRFNAQTGRFD